jgi:trk system potassium uptake protein TrkA
LLEGRVIAAAIELPGDSPLTDIAIKNLTNRDLLDRIRFIARLRQGGLHIPWGDTCFDAGDIVYAVGKQEDISELLYWCCPDTPHIDKVVIAGGAGTGLKLAAHLEQIMDVFLIEPNMERAQECSEVLDKTVVMHGDLLSQEIYQEISFTDRTAFVAAGPNDEDNIIASLLAQKRFSASFTVAQLKDLEYLPVIDGLEVVDRTVSIHLSLVNSVLQFIRGEHVIAATELVSTTCELLEIVVEENGRWNGQTIAHIRVPKESIIATILRGDEVIPATGQITLQTGDRLVVFASPKAANKLRSICGK